MTFIIYDLQLNIEYYFVESMSLRGSEATEAISFL